MQLMIIYFAPLQRIFKTAPLGLIEWVVILGISLLVLLISIVMQRLKKSTEEA